MFPPSFHRLENLQIESIFEPPWRGIVGFNPVLVWSDIMNMVAGFIGFSSFFLSLLAIGVVGYWQSDKLEGWMKKKMKKSR